MGRTSKIMSRIRRAAFAGLAAGFALLAGTETAHAQEILLIALDNGQAVEGDHGAALNDGAMERLDPLEMGERSLLVLDHFTP